MAHDQPLSRGYGTGHDKMCALLIRTVITCEECARQGRVTSGTIADQINSLALGVSIAAGWTDLRLSG